MKSKYRKNLVISRERFNRLYNAQKDNNEGNFTMMMEDPGFLNAVSTMLSVQELSNALDSINAELTNDQLDVIFSKYDKDILPENIRMGIKNHINQNRSSDNIARDDKGKSDLMYAVSVLHNFPIITYKLLMSYPIETILQDRDSLGRTVLMYACREPENESIIDNIIKKISYDNTLSRSNSKRIKDNLDLTDNFGFTALIYACISGSYGNVYTIIDLYPKDELSKYVAGVINKKGKSAYDIANFMYQKVLQRKWTRYNESEVKHIYNTLDKISRQSHSD